MLVVKTDENVRTTSPVPTFVSTKWEMVDDSRKQLPSLKELNAKLSANREARLADAQRNCLRLTGLPHL